MYNKFRNDVLLFLADLPEDILDRVAKCLDNVAQEYTITRASTELTVLGREEAEKLVKMYIVAKCLEGLQKTTISSYTLTLKNLVRSLTKPITEITTNDLRQYLAAYQLQRGNKPASVENKRVTLAGFFEWAHAEGYIQTNPMTRIKAIKYEKEQKPALTPEEMEKLRRVCRDDRDRALIEVLYSTGCRISELCNAKLEDIDWTTKPVSMSVIGKGNKKGKVFISPRAAALLQWYLNTRKHKSPHVICNIRGGGKMSKENAEKIFRKLRALADLEIKKVTPHTLRHTMATDALKTAPVQIVQKLLRHSKIDTTMIYAETDEEDVMTCHRRAMR